MSLERNALAAIYDDPAIRRRIKEYLGVSDRSDLPTAAFLARCDGFLPTDIERIPIESIASVLHEATDLARSLMDRESHIVHLDIEYVNFDAPAVPYLNPWHAFRLQEPVVNVIEEELARYGIRPLHLLTGQGHHFVWRVPRDSMVASRLASEVVTPKVGREVSGSTENEYAEAAFLGLGMAMEFLAQSIKKKSAPFCRVPVESTAAHVGPGSSGQREMISIDISEYGDPLPTRVIRLPFTHYRKPWQTGMVDRLGLEDQIPFFVTLPLHEVDVYQAIKIRQDVDDVISLARRSVVRIPDQEEGMSRLVAAYLKSDLHRFHEAFYACRHDAPDVWDRTYDRLDVDSLPACVRQVLLYPNDLLLKPVGLQLVTRVLLSLGWHPRHIAGLVRSIYEKPIHDWLDRYWEIYDPALRADFYVRVFSGEIATGLTDAVDFNCVSTQEKGFCPPPGCSEDLSLYREKLVNKDHED